jgi:uncharacterized protein YbjT (DUF2867 family)
MPEGPVLVVGATGRTGRLIVADLVDRAVHVRALVRDADKGREVLPAEVSQFIGDVRHPETLAAPIAGADAMIIATCSSPEHRNDAETVDYFGTLHLVEQASEANVGTILFVSSIHASRPEHYQDVEPTSLGWKAKAEEVVRGSGIPYTIVRPGWLTDGSPGASLTLSQGDMAEGRISRADLADVCVQLLYLTDARAKTLEVVAAPAGEGSDLASAVTALAPDADATYRGDAPTGSGA